MKSLVARCDIVLVVGSPASSNSNRLREIAEKSGIPGYLVDGPDDLAREWFDGKACVGVTAGASAPELLVGQVISRLKEWGGTGVEELDSEPEGIVFTVPNVLRSA